MLLSRRTRDHVPGMNRFDGTSPALPESATGHHDDRPTQAMGMPGRAGAGLERDARTLHAARCACSKQRLDAHLAGEPLRWSLARRSRTAPLDVHVLHYSLVDSGSDAGAVDDEAVAHVAALHALVRLIDLFSSDDLDVGDNSVFPAMVEHLLRFRNSADVGAGEALVPEDERARLDRGGGRCIGR